MRMSRPSFPGRDSGIVDLSPYLGRPEEPLLATTITETPRRVRRGTRLRDAGTILAAISMLLSSTALLITIRAEQGAISAAHVRVPEKAAKVAPTERAETPAQAVEQQTIEAEPEATAPPATQAGDGDLLARPRRPVAARPVRPAPVTTPSPATSAPGEPPSGPRTLDELMSGATAVTLPETPSRDEVARVLRGLSSRVAQCRPQDMEPTTVTTRVTIDGATGRVTSATVDGELQWSVTGACIVEKLSTARFSPFARDRFEVQFPYRL